MIEALVRVQTYKVSFPVDTESGSKAVWETRSKLCQSDTVRDALISLADGVDFGFDVDKWRAWHAERKASQNQDKQ